MRIRRLAAAMTLLLVFGAGLPPVMATTQERGLPIQPSGERPSGQLPAYAPVCTRDAHACLHMARALRPPDTPDRRVARPKVSKVKKAPPTITTQAGRVVKHGNGSNPEPVAQP